MSPEQINQDPAIDHRTDIYGLGAVLYEILCGQTPSSGEKFHHVIQSTLNDIPVPLKPQPPKEKSYEKAITFDSIGISIVACSLWIGNGVRTGNCDNRLAIGGYYLRRRSHHHHGWLVCNRRCSYW
ncbi:MAG: hypothetical protein IIC59_10620 [Proteobacteria bacterium]|nr:hypothetical protein [Pseudomonadota bacterium]